MNIYIYLFLTSEYNNKRILSDKIEFLSKY